MQTTTKVNLTIPHLVSVHLKCRHFSEKTAHRNAAPDNHTRHGHEAKLHNEIICKSFHQKRSSTFKHISKYVSKLRYKVPKIKKNWIRGAGTVGC